MQPTAIELTTNSSVEEEAIARKSEANSSLYRIGGSRIQSSALQSLTKGTETAPISAVVVTVVRGALLIVILRT